MNSFLRHTAIGGSVASFLGACSAPPTPLACADGGASLEGSAGPSTVTVLSSFAGTSGPGYKDHPDLGGAVGLHHVVDFVGSAFTVRDKATGTVLQQLTQDQFWAAAGVTPQTLNDPRLVYDPLTDRFYAVTAGPYDFLAVSSDGDPTHPWQAVTLTTSVSGDLLARVGFDRNGVYVCSYGGTVDSICFAIPTADVMWTATTPLSLAHMTTFTGQPYEVFPAVDLDPAKAPDAPELFLTRQGLQNETNLPLVLVLERLTWAGTVATLAAPQLIPTPLQYTVPADAAQPGNGMPPLKGRENHRFFGVVSSGGSLFAAQGTQRGSHTAINWFEVRVTDGSLVQSGTLADGCADLMFPSLATDAFGNLGIAYTRVSASEYASIDVAARRAGDPPGTLRTPFTAALGTASFQCTTSPVGWGTYTSTMRDPSDPMRLWTFQEYAASPTACQWSTRWVSFSL